MDRPYRLEERTQLYAQNVILFLRACPRDIVNTELSRQAIRAAGSVGANYIEANECLGEKDRIMRLRLCRKEIKESRYWLQLFEIEDKPTDEKRSRLIIESTELLKIFNSIISKLASKSPEKDSSLKPI